jgi:hypothetical protein
MWRLPWDKRLLIFKSHNDLNRCTLCKGKPDQHATHFPRSVCVWTSTICISHGPRIAIFCESSTGLDGCTAPGKKCSRLRLSAQQSGMWDPPQFLSQHSQWRSALKPSTCCWQATRFTGLISPACDRYIQYLLVGANSSVLNRHRRGLQPWRCRLATRHSPTFPTSNLHFPPKGLARSPVKQNLPNIPRLKF